MKLVPILLACVLLASCQTTRPEGEPPLPVDAKNPAPWKEAARGALAKYYPAFLEAFISYLRSLPVPVK